MCSAASLHKVCSNDADTDSMYTGSLPGHCILNMSINPEIKVFGYDLLSVHTIMNSSYMSLWSREQET